MTIWIYRFLLFPLAFFTAHLLALVNPKVKEGLNLRKKPWPKKSPFDTRPIWIHAASGEFEYAKPVITELKKQHPSTPILVTYFSPTFQKAVRAYPGVDLAMALPLDSWWTIRRFLNFFSPQMLLIARTDLWLEILYQCRRRNIPRILFSATLSDEGRKLANPWSRAWARIVLRQLSRIFCVGCEDRAAFGKLLEQPFVLTKEPCSPQATSLSMTGTGGPSIEVLGDTRYDQVQARLKLNKPLKETLRAQPNGKLLAPNQIFVAGSTWPEDEKELLLAYGQTRAQNIEPSRWIWVPHEPTPSHLEVLEEQIRNAGFQSIRYSTATAWPENTILLVDQMGILAELYQWGAWALVGGAFRNSVHSVMEPLAAGCFTFFGPHHRNNREALEFQKLELGTKSDPSQPIKQKITLAESVSTGAALVEALTQRQGVQEWKSAIQIQIRNRSGASASLVDCIQIKK